MKRVATEILIFWMACFYIIFGVHWISRAYAEGGVKQVGEIYQQTYQILDTAGAPVTGQTVTVKIKKQSNGQYFDFSDSTFKASGWTSLTANMSYDSTGEFYFYTWTPPASETSSNQYVFTVANSNATYKDNQQESVYYQQTDKLVKIHR